MGSKEQPSTITPPASRDTNGIRVRAKKGRDEKLPSPEDIPSETREWFKWIDDHKEDHARYAKHFGSVITQGIGDSVLEYLCYF